MLLNYNCLFVLKCYVSYSAKLEGKYTVLVIVEPVKMLPTCIMPVYCGLIYFFMNVAT